MKEEQNRAVLVTLINALREKGSWCGETHIQKAAFFLKKLAGVPVDFDFILYKHGPYSFDLHDELSVMRAFGLLDLEVSYPYGPRIANTDMGSTLLARFPKKPAQYQRQISFVADKLGDKGVVDLERLATAYFVTLDHPESDQETRSKAIVKLKPHIAIDSARQAVADVDCLVEEVRAANLRAA